MKLARFTLGQVVATGIMAVAFILVLKFVALKWPRLPVISGVAKAI